jgi:hypothetical protein
MPCNIGYRIIAPIKLPDPVPQEFKSKAQAPKIDADLLKKLGEEDEVFQQWVMDLNSIPLLKEALARAKKASGKLKNLEFRISSAGYLEAKASYVDRAEKDELEKMAASLASRFQLEVMKIIADLLDYQVVVTQSDKGWEIEGEKNEEGNVHKYIRIARINGGQDIMALEHFQSQTEADLEMKKFLALAQKLGIGPIVSKPKKGGQPIASDVVHKDFLPAANKN